MEWAIGFGGVVVGFILGLVRDNWLWRRQLSLYEQQWERAQTQQQEQWERERETRWKDQQRDVYARILSAATAAVREAESAQHHLRMRSQRDESTRRLASEHLAEQAIERFDIHEHAFETASEDLLLISSREMQSIVAPMTVYLYSISVILLRQLRGDNPEELGELDEKFGKAKEAIHRFRERAREDLEVS